MLNMKTVVETSLFQRKADDLWSDQEWEDFVLQIVANPFAREAVFDTGGVL